MYLTPGFFEQHRNWPVAWELGVPLLLIVFDLTPLGSNLLFFLMAMPALMGAWGIAAVVAVVKATQAVVRGQWKRAALTAVLPATVLCTLRRTPTNGLPRVFLTVRSSGYTTSRGFVYDESDQILLDRVSRTTTWEASVDQSPLACPFGAEPVPGPGFLTRHWYSFSSEC